jgi:hypothetical protein
MSQNSGAGVFNAGLTEELCSGGLGADGAPERADDDILRRQTMINADRTSGDANKKGRSRRKKSSP